MFLSKKEICELTGRKRIDCQIRALGYMGVTFEIRPNGSVVVLREHIKKKLGCGEVNINKPQYEPNWGAVNA